jgi:hypothetical protein
LSVNEKEREWQEQLGSGTLDASIIYLSQLTTSRLDPSIDRRLSLLFAADCRVLVGELAAAC